MGWSKLGLPVVRSWPEKHDGPQEVLGTEKPEGLSDGVNILFGDGQVEFVTMARAMQMINEARGRGLK